MERVKSSHIIAALVLCVAVFVFVSISQGRKISKLENQNWEQQYEKLTTAIEENQVRLDSALSAYYAGRDSLQIRIDNYEKFIQKLTDRRYSASDVVRIGREIFGAK